MAAILEINDLEISFRQGRQWAPCTDGVSFQVSEGEILSLVGESGCGKSITALSVLGLLSRQGRVTRGSIRFMEQELLAMDERRLDHIRGR